MAKRRRRRSRRNRRIKFCLSVVAVVLVLLVGVIGAQQIESRMNVKIENAGMQMTAHMKDENTAQIFVNGQWYRKKDVETLLVIGIDDFGSITGSSSYNNTNQADFLVLFVRNTETGESKAIHLNRDTMTDITMLGVTGEAAGVQYAQLAVAYNYGRGQQDSCRNTADAISNLLYGMEIDHYIAVTMDAVPIMNDWAGGVTVEVMDDMTSADSALVFGEEIKLSGEQALAYVRTRKGLDDSTNINRMERQRQYASAWVTQAQGQLNDSESVMQFIMQMSDYHYSDCTVEELAEFAGRLGENPSVDIYELPGESVHGEQYMEFYVNEEGVQQLVLDLFYEPVD